MLYAIDFDLLIVSGDRAVSGRTRTLVSGFTNGSTPAARGPSESVRIAAVPPSLDPETSERTDDRCRPDREENWPNCPMAERPPGPRMNRPALLERCGVVYQRPLPYLYLAAGAPDGEVPTRRDALPLWRAVPRTVDSLRVPRIRSEPRLDVESARIAAPVTGRRRTAPQISVLDTRCRRWYAVDAERGLQRRRRKRIFQGAKVRI